MCNGTRLDCITTDSLVELVVDVATATLTVVCSWCECIIRRGTPTASVTHTICSSCIDRMMSAQLPVWHPPADYYGDFFDPVRPRRRES